MTNCKKYNLFVFLSMIGRSMIETFPPLILYNYGISIKLIIFYFFIRYLSAIPINILFVKMTKKFGSKLMVFISSITIGITYYYLYNMEFSIINIVILSILTTTYVYSYWTVRNYYMLQVINRNTVTSNMSYITIVNILAIMPAVYIGAFILEKFNLLTLIMIVFIINILSVIPLLFIKTKNIDESGLKGLKNIPNVSKVIMLLDQFKTIILSIFPLYIYIYINQNYTYLGVFNLLTGLASILVVYVFSKIITLKHKSYLSITIILLSVCFLIKLFIHDNYIFLSIAILEGIFTKMEELSISSNIYKLGKNFNYMSYILITENLFNLSRIFISSILLLFNNILTMLIICIIGFFTCSFFKFEIEPKK